MILSIWINSLLWESYNLNFIFQIIMKPRRPDSAKSTQTKRTLDSQISKQQLNSSKFSQTFSSGVNSLHQKPDQFQQYVAQKDKDPKFKHLKSKLEVIQQKTAKVEEAKPSFKPFQRKKEKTIEKTTKKIQEKQQKQQKQQDPLNLSKGFAEKNKQKMNSLKMANQQKKEEEKVAQKIKSKINFDAFKVTKPGEKKQIKKQIRPEPKKQQKVINQSKSPKKQQQKGSQQKTKTKKNAKNQQQVKRQQQMNSLQRFVSDMQARNMEIFPPSYDRMLAANPSNVSDLQKIDLNQFLQDPTEQDYDTMKFKIRQLDRQIQQQKLQQSIDLQEILAGDTETDQQAQQTQQNQSYLNSMSASELKKRNAFITEVLSGKISKKELDQLEEMDRSAIRIHKLQQHSKEDDQVQLTEINMVKRQSNRLMERNRIEAAGQLYRDCDFLSEQHQKRLEELLNGDIGQSPYDCNQLESMRRRGIDEGIRMYREMSDAQQPRDFMSDQNLPKDPELRKQAQKKVLRQRIASVNQRLVDVSKVVVTKAKIQALIKKFQHTRPSSSYQQLFDQNRGRYDEQFKKLQQAERIISQMGQKQNLQDVLVQIQSQYRQLQRQIKTFQQIDQKQLKRMEKERLRRKLRQLEEVQNQNNDLEIEIGHMERIKKEVQQKLKLYDQLQPIIVPIINCQGYTSNETLDDLDALITSKWQKSQQPFSQ